MTESLPSSYFDTIDTPEKAQQLLKKRQDRHKGEPSAFAEMENNSDTPYIKQKLNDYLEYKITPFKSDPECQALLDKLKTNGSKLSLQDLNEIYKDYGVFLASMDEASISEHLKQNPGLDRATYKQYLRNNVYFSDVLTSAMRSGSTTEENLEFNEKIAKRFNKQFLKKSDPARYIELVARGAIEEFDEEDLLIASDQVKDSERKIEESEKSKKMHFGKLRETLTKQRDEAQQKAIEANQNVEKSYTSLQLKKAALDNILFKRQYTAFQVDGYNISTEGEPQDKVSLNEDGLRQNEILEDNARREYLDALKEWELNVELAQKFEQDEEAAQQKLDDVSIKEKEENDKIDQMKNLQ